MLPAAQGSIPPARQEILHSQHERKTGALFVVTERNSASDPGSRARVSQDCTSGVQGARGLGRLGPGRPPHRVFLMLSAAQQCG